VVLFCGPEQVLRTCVQDLKSLSMCSQTVRKQLRTLENYTGLVETKIPVGSTTEEKTRLVRVFCCIINIMNLYTQSFNHEVLHHKAEIIITPKYKNLLKEFDKDGFFSKIQKKLEIDIPENHDTKMDEVFEKFVNLNKKGLFSYYQARFIIFHGIRWSDIDKTFIENINLSKKIFGEENEPKLCINESIEPVLLLDQDEPFSHKDYKSLYFSWSNAHLISSFPIGLMRVFDKKNKEMNESPIFLKEVEKAGFKKILLDEEYFEYETFENDFFIIEYRDLVSL